MLVFYNLVDSGIIMVNFVIVFIRVWWIMGIFIMVMCGYVKVIIEIVL